MSEPRTVVVVPFFNGSGDPADDGLALGIAEAIIGDLQRFPSLAIVRPDALLATGLQAAQGEPGDEPFFVSSGISTSRGW